MILQTTAYILHRRNYRDHSLLLECFSKEYGRITVLCRGIKQKKAQQYLCRPFVPLTLFLKSLQDLSVLTAIEMNVLSRDYRGNALYAGLYLNELLYRLLAKQAACQDIYDNYEVTLQAIADQKDFFMAVRQFEFYLLSALGYGLSLQYDAQQKPIVNNAIYRFDVGVGFTLLPNEMIRTLADHYKSLDTNYFSGDTLLKIQAWELKTARLRHASKYLLSCALKPLLGDKPVHALMLWAKQRAYVIGLQR